MWKEATIVMIIILAILWGNWVTENYTKQSVDLMTQQLETIKQEMGEEEKDHSLLVNHMEEIEEKWTDIHDKMAYYIEHDELEKVDTDLTAMKSYIQTEEYEEAISELDKAVFCLNHIEEKYILELQNIF
jgi:predicted metalloprotease